MIQRETLKDSLLQVVEQIAQKPDDPLFSVGVILAPNGTRVKRYQLLYAPADVDLEEWLHAKRQAILVL